MRATEELLRIRPDLKAVRDLLLTFGGEEIDVPPGWVLHPESVWGVWISPLLHHGRLMEDPVRKERMEPKECHKNTTRKFLDQQVTSFATGFALHPDGAWYFHSWGIRKNNGETAIIETVEEPFEKYFGAEYAGEEGIRRAEGLYATVTLL